MTMPATHEHLSEVTHHQNAGEFIEDSLQQYGWVEGQAGVRVRMPEKMLETAEAVLKKLDVEVERDQDGEIQDETFKDPLTGQEIDAVQAVDFRSIVQLDREYYDERRRRQAERPNPTWLDTNLDDQRNRRQDIQTHAARRKRAGNKGGSANVGTAPVANLDTRDDNGSMGEQRPQEVQKDVYDTARASQDQETVNLSAPAAAAAPDSAPLSGSASAPARFGGPPPSLSRESGAAPAGSQIPAERQAFIEDRKKDANAPAAQDSQGEPLASGEPEAPAPERTGRVAQVTRALGLTALGQKLASRYRRTEGSDSGPDSLPAERRGNILREWRDRFSERADRKPEGWAAKTRALGGVALAKSREASSFMYNSGRDYYTDPEKGQRRLIGTAVGVLAVSAVAIYAYRSGNLDLLGNMTSTPDIAPPDGTPTPDLAPAPHLGTVPDAAPPHAEIPTPAVPEAPQVHALDVSLVKGSNPWDAIAEHMGYNADHLNNQQTYVVDAIKDYVVQHDLQGMDTHRLAVGTHFTVPDAIIRDILERAKDIK